MLNPEWSNPLMHASASVWVEYMATTVLLFKQFPHLKRKPYWGNHFWAQGYCVGTVGLDEEMIRKYVKYQEGKERHEEQLKLQY
jgi:putative transposase